MNPIKRREWLKASAITALGLTGLSYTNWSKAFANGSKGDEDATFLKNIPSDAPLFARLSSNENPFGPSKSAKKALFEAVEDSFLYPNKYRQQLVELIAKTEGLTPEHILLGAGSSELLDAGARVFSANGGRVLSADPTYASLVRSAERYGAESIKVPLTKDHDHDLDTMETLVGSKSISLVYLCNPNNPTGKIIPAAQLKDFCATVSPKVPIFIDEAYIDYVPNPAELSATDCIKKGMNVIIARTFSKVHAFAGLRVGYCIAQPEMIKRLAAEGPRNSLSGPSMNAAAASYQDNEFIQYSVDRTKEAKQYVYSLLKDKGYDYLPSYTNFILFPLKMKGRKFQEEMMARNVGLKSWEFSGQDFCRVSMGKMTDMEMFATAFYKIV